MGWTGPESPGPLIRLSGSGTRTLRRISALYSAKPGACQWELVVDCMVHLHAVRWRELRAGTNTVGIHLVVCAARVDASLDL
jgi:hypothetical protein